MTPPGPRTRRWVAITKLAHALCDLARRLMLWAERKKSKAWFEESQQRRKR